MPAFYQMKRPLVYYAAFKGHCSFCPASMAVMREFANELRRFETSKGRSGPRSGSRRLPRS